MPNPRWALHHADLARVTLHHDGDQNRPLFISFLGSSDFYSHWLVSGLRFFGPWGLSLKLLDAES